MKKPILKKGEVLKDISGYEGLYAVTNQGRVWSYPKFAKKSSPRNNGKWLKKTLDNGYETVGLRKNKKAKKKLVHRIVAFAFLSKKDNKLHINHKNGLKNDNNVGNIEWCTPKENCKHAWATGLSKVGENLREESRKKMNTWVNSEKGKKHCSESGKAKRKLSHKQVVSILRRSNKGESGYSIAKDFPIAKQNILKIIRRETYTEVMI